MKPADFELHRPATVAEAIALLATYGEDGKVLAGGQSLMPLLNFRLARPGHLIDLSRIAALRALRRSSDSLVIGAMVTHSEAARSSAVDSAAPLVAAALPHIAHQAIRNRGTLGGSVAHGDPAAELPAVLTALDATMVAASIHGTRLIPAAEFFVANLVTTLRHDELLTEIRLTPPLPRTGAAFEEVGRRRGDFALAGAGAQLTLDDEGAVVDARIALTGVSPRPHRAGDAERALDGARVTADVLEQVSTAVRDSVEPSDDLHASAEYRRDVAGTLAARAVARAAAQATNDTLNILEVAQ